MKKSALMVLVVLAVVALVTVAGVGSPLIWAQEKESESPVFGPKYLYIAEYEIGTGQSVNEAIAECTKWVKGMRETGEFLSVRLYMHNTGPRAAVYILAETKSWQAIEDGHEKWMAAMPGFLDTKWKFGTHSDNLLSEIEVK
jgi:hypothetical protein